MKTLFAIGFVGMVPVSVFIVLGIIGCANTDINGVRIAATAMEAYEAYQDAVLAQEEAVISNAVEGAEGSGILTEGREGHEGGSWRTWPGAPDKLVVGAPYHKNHDGNFEYRGGGHGLYKPESRLWLVRGLKAEHVAVGAVYLDAECTKPVIRNGACVFLRHDNRPTDEAHPIQNPQDPNHYHPPHLTLGGFKFRGATAVESRQVLGCWTKDGRLYAKYIYDRDVRQK